MADTTVVGDMVITDAIKIAVMKMIVQSHVIVKMVAENLVTVQNLAIANSNAAVIYHIPVIRNFPDFHVVLT